MTRMVRDWLVEEGYGPVFVDFDRNEGLVGGKEWWSQLSSKQKQAKVFVVLVSRNWLESLPCRDELTIARHEGKPIIAVRLDDCQPSGYLPRIHYIQFRGDAETWQRLTTALQEAGASPSVFKPSPERPPFPGLLAFDVDDAALYFGREAEVVDVLARIERSRQGDKRLFVVAGPSGSGKSSLLRAGVLSRLRRRSPEWVATMPLRPGLGFEQGILAPIEETCRAWYSAPVPRAQIRALLDPDRATADGLATFLREVAGHLQATPILAIDQGEELLANAPDEDLDRISRLLSRLLAVGSPLLGMLTIRSDMLGVLQKHATVGPLIIDDVYALPPMPRQRYALLIDGPIEQYARHVQPGARVEPALRDELIAAADGADALPVVAFALGTLWTEYGPPDGVLLREHLDALGGVAGAVAKIAEEQIEAELTTPGGCNLTAVRRAFVPCLATVTSTGEVRRRRAPEASLPRAAVHLLERFVAARLLVRDRGEDGIATLEIAHEALLRQWPRLVGWIEEDLGSLRLLEGLGRAAAAWRAGQKHPDLQTHRGERLVEARKVMASDLLESSFSPEDRAAISAYVDACSLSERKSRAQVLAHEITLSAALFEKAQREADQHRFVHAAALLGAALDVNPCARAAETAREVLSGRELGRGIALSWRIRSTLYEILPRVLYRFERQVQFNTGPRSRLIFHTRRPVLVAIDALGVMDLDLDSGDVKKWPTTWNGEVLDYLPEVDVALVRRKGEFLTANATSGEVLSVIPLETESVLWHGRLLDNGHAAAILSLQKLFYLAFGSGEAHDLTQQLQADGGSSLFASLATVGQQVVVGGSDALHVVDPETMSSRRLASGQSLSIDAIAYDDESNSLVYAGVDPRLRVLSPNGGAARTIGSHDDNVSSIAVLGTERLVLSTGWDGRVALWDLDAGQHSLDLASVGGMLRACAASRDGKWLAIAGDRGPIALWSRLQQPQVLTLPHGNTIMGAAYNPARAGELVSCGFVGDVCAALWTIRGGKAQRRDLGIRAPLRGVAMAPKGDVFAVCGNLPEILVYTAYGELLQTFTSEGDFDRREDRHDNHPDFVPNVTISYDSRRVAWVAPTGRLWQGDIATGGTRLLVPDGKTVFRSVCFSPTDDAFVTVHGDDRVVSWHPPLADSTCLLSGASARSTYGRGTPMAFSTDGATLAVPVQDTGIVVLSTVTGEVIHRLDGHTDTFKRGWHEDVGALAFDPEGEFLVSGGSRQSGDDDPRTIRLWDLATGDLLLRVLTDGDCLAAAVDPFSGHVCVAADQRLLVLPLPRFLLADDTAHLKRLIEGYLGSTAVDLL